ncbi:hypothetical protein GCM10027342_40510 [Photobacterium alginatilyticum]
MQTLTVLEQQVQPMVQAKYEAIQEVWNASVRLEYTPEEDSAHLADVSSAEVPVKAAE